MPRIHRQHLDCVFYLYKSREDAEAGINIGGTGFLVATPTSDGLGHHYGVTNWHVAVKSGASVIRLNTVDGGIDIIELGPEDWLFEPGKDDIAIAPLSIRRPEQKAWFIGISTFITRELADKFYFGPGDDVFMIGRFVDLDEKETNTPSLRFGNISTQPVRVTQPTKYKDGFSYCVDMHSRSGYSGSPDFVYRTPGNDLAWAIERGPIDISNARMMLLGIHWGQFPEDWDVIEEGSLEESSVSSLGNGKKIRGLSGMTCVIPAWRIMDILNSENLGNQRKAIEKSRGSETTAEKPMDSGLRRNDGFR